MNMKPLSFVQISCLAFLSVFSTDLLSQVLAYKHNGVHPSDLPDPTPLSPCPDPGTPSHGSRHLILGGRMIKFFCHPGFKRVGPVSIICVKSHWSDLLPSCQPITDRDEFFTGVSKSSDWHSNSKERFSKVRLLSGSQYEDGYNIKSDEHNTKEANRNALEEIRRPLFSWDSGKQELVTEDQELPNSPAKERQRIQPKSLDNSIIRSRESYRESHSRKHSPRSNDRGQRANEDERNTNLEKDSGLVSVRSGQRSIDENEEFANGRHGQRSKLKPISTDRGQSSREVNEDGERRISDERSNENEKEVNWRGKVKKEENTIIEFESHLRSDEKENDIEEPYFRYEKHPSEIKGVENSDGEGLMVGGMNEEGSGDEGEGEGSRGESAEYEEGGYSNQTSVEYDDTSSGISKEDSSNSRINHDDQIQGDTSCVIPLLIEAPYFPNTLVKYARRLKSSGVPYAMAVYECIKGFEMRTNSEDSLVCDRGRWVGKTPKCNKHGEEHHSRNETPSSVSSSSSEISECGPDKGGCNQICHVSKDEEGKEKNVCSCHRGYTLADDGKNCQDIDECLNLNGGCEYKCQNTIGSFKCQCDEGYRIGVNGRNCIDRNECLLRNGHGPCQDNCVNLIGGYQCNCDNITGTKLSPDKHTCQDIDECSVGNFGCSHQCINAFGSAFCTCPDGFLLDLDWKTCQDMNECEFDSDAMSCPFGCINTPGSYRCKEEEKEDKVRKVSKEEEEESQEEVETEKESTPDLNVSTVNESDEVFEEACPGPGFEPDENGDCQDIDECRTNNGDCEHICINENGYHTCQCRPGYKPTHNNKNKCEDIDECLIDNFNCSHRCINTIGSAKCSCLKGYRLIKNGKKCRKKKKQRGICKPLINPVQGSLECLPKKLKRLFKAGTVCNIKCNEGYRRSFDAASVTCGTDSYWKGNSGICIRDRELNNELNEIRAHLENHWVSSNKIIESKAVFSNSVTEPLNITPPERSYIHFSFGFPKPWIRCPQDINTELKTNSKLAYVSIPQPKTNVDWWRNVISEPFWAKKLEGEFPVGSTRITFRTSSVFSNQSAHCTFFVNVKDLEPPAAYNCPHRPIEVELPINQKRVKVTWNEPLFRDNIGVKLIKKSHLSGDEFGIGHHSVTYKAVDQENNIGICSFIVQVSSDWNRTPVREENVSGNRRDFMSNRNNVWRNLMVARARSGGGYRAQNNDYYASASAERKLLN